MLIHSGIPDPNGLQFRLGLLRFEKRREAAECDTAGAPRSLKFVVPSFSFEAFSILDPTGVGSSVAEFC